ncbi:MAG: YlmC/YmxH family sporulation protein [Clostridiales bacterium]|nr:YlmC/YmxH family sporulation protein [Clostridiales bacterium]MCD7827501.1 YlmC/YmxH family sporulation protein [Clostridiales bacterium]
MRCSVTSLCDKDIITVSGGLKLGTVGDVEFDCETGKITCIVICGKSGFLGLTGKTEDIRINWEDIRVIGDDTILVEKPA